jgi:hypothetical protein
MPIIRTEARRLYCCDCCGKTDVWDDNWCWYGSYRQLEDEGMKDSKPVITICSADCRIRLIADGTLPHDGIDDNGNVIDDEKDDHPPRQKRRTKLVSSQVRQTQGE